jgi:DNA-binding NarL/FixJ family response regulator
MSGKMWVGQKVIQLMADQVQQGEEVRPGPWLTESEQQMLQGVFEGLANKEIAARLGVTEGAVKASLQQLFQRT